MTAASHAEVRRLFLEACRLAEAQRSAFLDQECAPDLRAEVDALLAADAEDDAFGADVGEGAALLADALAREGSDAPQVSHDWLPPAIGHYRVLRLIGRGGMGIVYEAEQEAPRRRVALKLLHPMLATPSTLARFRNEARTLGRLRHPGIAQIFESGTYDAGRGHQPFFAMELIEGLDVLTHVEHQGIDRPGRLALLAKIADAVQYAHDQGVVHRDLKPDNVLMDEFGEPRVLDFGIARVRSDSDTLSTIVTGEGALVGTLAYMAPEQLEGTTNALDHRVDVYALGVLGFQLVTGRLPREIADLSLSQAITLIAHSEATRASAFDPSLRGDVDTILAKAMESDPARRYAGAGALAGDVRRHLDHQPIRARPPSRIYLARKFARRHRGLVAGTLAALLALGVGLIVSLHFAHTAREQRDLALESEQRALNGLLQSAEILIEAGHERDAVTQLQLVPPDARGVAWRLLDRAVPFVIDELYGRWMFLDEEHIVGVRRDGPGAVAPERSNPLLVYSLVEHRTVREAFAGLGLHRIEAASPSGLVVASRADDSGAWLEFLLLDLEREAVVSRPPFFAARGAIPLLEGHAVLGQEREGYVMRTPEISRDGRTQIWYTSASEAEVRVDGEVVRVVRDLSVTEAVHLGPDGRLLAENRDGAVSVFDVASGALRLRYAFDPAHAASGVPVQGGVILCDYPELPPGFTWDGKRAWRRFAVPDEGPAVEASDPCGAGADLGEDFRNASVAFPDHGRFLAVNHLAGETSGAYVFDTTTGAPLAFGAFGKDPAGHGGFLPFEERTGAVVAVSPSGTRLILHHQAAAARIVELDPRDRDADFDPRCTILRGHADREGKPGSGWIYHLAISNDGSLVASSAPLDPLVRVWDARTGGLVATLERDCGIPWEQNPGSWESLMAFRSDDERLLLTTPFGGLGLCVVDWDLVTGEVVLVGEPLPHSESHLLVLDRFVEALAPSARTRLSQRVQMEGERALVAFEPPTPGLFEMPRPPHGERWDYVPGLPGKAVGLSVHPSRPEVAVVQQVGRSTKGTGILKVLDTRSGEILVERELDFAPWCVAYSPDGGTLAIGTLMGYVLFFETERYTQQLAFRAHEGASNPYIHSLAWTSDGTRLVTASGDETLRVWDTHTRVASRLERDRWEALRAEMTGRDDLERAFATLQGEERQAARVERILRSRAR